MRPCKASSNNSLARTELTWLLVSRAHLVNERLSLSPLFRTVLGPDFVILAAVGRRRRLSIDHHPATQHARSDHS